MSSRYVRNAYVIVPSLSLIIFPSMEVFKKRHFIRRCSPGMFIASSHFSPWNNDPDWKECMLNLNNRACL